MMTLTEALRLLEILDVPLPRASNALIAAINSGKLELTAERNLIFVTEEELIPNDGWEYLKELIPDV